jgi:uncharacterized protein YjbI with pentapeptide repeats
MPDVVGLIFSAVGSVFGLATNELEKAVDKDTVARNTMDRLADNPLGLSGLIADGYDKKALKKWLNTTNAKAIYESMSLSEADQEKQRNDLLEDLNRKTRAMGDSDKCSYNKIVLDSIYNLMQICIENHLNPGEARILDEARQGNRSSSALLERALRDHRDMQEQATALSNKVSEQMGELSKQVHKLPEEVVKEIKRASAQPQEDFAYSWDAYSKHLIEEVEKPIFGQNFSTKDIYVPLNAYYLQNEHSASSEDSFAEETHDDRSRDEGRRGRRIAVEIDGYLDAWLEAADGPQTVLLSGKPGSGKSTVAQMFAARTCEQGKKNVIFVAMGELHNWTKGRNMIDIITSYFAVKLPGEEPGNYLFDNTLLILDGADELPIEDNCGVLQFMELLNILMSNRRDMKVLITCRELLTPVIPGRPDKKQELTLMDYVVDNTGEYFTSKAAKEYHLKNEQLREDKREIWWKKYGDLTNKGYKGLPQKLKKWDEKEGLTRQPLLNFLVALEYATNPSGWDEDTNLYSLYERLVNRVCSKEYAVSGEYTAAKSRIDPQQLEVFLELAALEAWQGGGRLGSCDSLAESCEQQPGLKQTLAEVRGRKIKGILNLLVLFFTRGASNHECYEFSHQSFMEYFVAKQIVQLVKGLDAAGDVSKPLHDWLRLTEPQQMSAHMVDFVEYGLKYIGPTGLDKALKPLHTMLHKAINEGLPFREDHKELPFKQKLQYERNAEEALLIVNNMVTRILNSRLRLNDYFTDTSPRSLGIWFHFLSNSRTKLYVRYLAGVDLTGADLTGVDLTHARLTGADLARADFTRADLTGANLTGAGLTRAGLTRANLTGARLTGANLTGVDLTRADFTRADLTGANLTGAYLAHADLAHARLTGARLTRARLTGAYLAHADLARARLTGANLIGANLTDARLTGARLTGAYLIGANLTDANLTDVDLRDVRTVFIGGDKARRGRIFLVAKFVTGAKFLRGDLAEDVAAELEKRGALILDE